MFLAVACPGFGQTPAVMPPKPEVAISVYDYANVSTELLAAAEEDAQRVFRQAGVETLWTTCLPKKGKARSRFDDCYKVDDTHLMLKILPHAIAKHVRDRGDVLGAASVDESGASYYAYVFYDNVQRVAEQRKLGHALLGDVLAHEIGHLLLGSNSHSVSGIMSAHWYGDELRRISEATIFFVPSQSRTMRDRFASRKLDGPAVPGAIADASGAPHSTKVPTPGLATVRE